jgi:hypothetical protein
VYFIDSGTFFYKSFDYDTPINYYGFGGLLMINIIKPSDDYQLNYFVSPVAFC